MKYMCSAMDSTLGVRIRKKRKEHHFSQAELAQKLGTNAQQIRRYERGVSRVPASVLAEISKALDTSICVFFDGLCSTKALSPLPLMSSENFDMYWQLCHLKQEQQALVLRVIQALAIP